ncbi:MAG: P-II family nitrogen regulator [Myxococcota bacterium]|nr:P-II family nitrogen regulator [Myxococcota bacterium]
MKRIVAVIKPHKIDDAKAALGQAGVPGMTLAEVRGFGRQKGHKELYRGAEYTVNLIPKLRLEIVVADDMAEKVTEALCTSCKSGTLGDGKIFVESLDDAVRVRTGEAGEAAL